MTDNQRIEFEALIAVREGMNAENQRREGANESPAFGADDFDAIAEKMRTLKGPEEEVRDTPPPENKEHTISQLSDLAMALCELTTAIERCIVNINDIVAHSPVTPPPKPEWKMGGYYIDKDRETICNKEGAFANLRATGNDYRASCDVCEIAEEIVFQANLARETVEWMEWHRQEFPDFPYGDHSLRRDRDEILARAKKGPKP